MCYKKMFKKACLDFWQLVCVTVSNSKCFPDIWLTLIGFLKQHLCRNLLVAINLFPAGVWVDALLWTYSFLFRLDLRIFTILESEPNDLWLIKKS